MASGYKIKLLCFDYGNPVPYVDSPAIDPVYASKHAAFLAAVKMAEDEVDDLNLGCDDGLHFGIFEDEDDQDKRVIVNAYFEDTSVTETVTVYFFEEVS